MNHKCPALAVDVICLHVPSNKIILIERKFPPLGLAIPGGFVDEGESCEHAARREMKEEIDVDLRTLQLLGVYSDPSRDPRKHVVSVAYVGITIDMPCAGDDAKSYVMVDVEEALEMTLCFDHTTIIRDARRRGMI